MFLLLIDSNHIFENTWKASSVDGRLDATTFFNKCLASVDRAIAEHSPSHVLFAISDSSQSIRKDKESSYRFGNWVLPESYRVKMYGFRKALKARGVAFTSYPGVEARDIIATITTKIKANPSVSVGILSSAKSLWPLVSDQVVMINHYAKFPDERLIKKEDLEKRLGFSGQKVMDMLVLEGDRDLNIAGVKGVGRKKSTSLIQKYGSLSAINARIAEMEDSLKGEIQSFFEDGARTAYVMWKNVDKLKLGFQFNDLKYKERKPSDVVELKADELTEKMG